MTTTSSAGFLGRVLGEAALDNWDFLSRPLGEDQHVVFDIFGDGLVDNLLPGKSTTLKPAWLSNP